jgi:hypothetical protein
MLHINDIFSFNIGLTPYGQSVCMAELQLKKRYEMRVSIAGDGRDDK